jgi:hypothetical protein
LQLCHDVERLEPDLTSQMPAAGSLYDWLQLTVQQVGCTLVQRLEAEGFLFAQFAAGIAPQRLRAFWRKLVQREIYDPILLGLLAQQQGQLFSGAPQVLVLANVADLAPALTDAVRTSFSPAVQIQFLGYADVRTSSLVRVARLCFYLLWQVTQRLKAWGTFGLSVAAVKPATVALEYAWGFGSEADRLNDLWWYAASGLPPARCLIFFDRARSQATDEAIDHLQRGGYRYRILYADANASATTPTAGFPAQPISRTVFDGLWLMRLLLKAPRSMAPAWHVARCAHVVGHLRRWQALMEAEHIKVLFSVEETNLDAMSLAADLVGAIRLGYHWSQLYPTSGALLPLHQVYGVWGPQHQAIVSDRWGSCAEVILQTGCIFHHLSDGPVTSQGVASMRRCFGETTRVIGVLDRSLGLASHYSSTQHRQFYDAMLTWAEANPRIGLLIKPKHPTPKIFASTPGFLARLQALMAEGRAVLLEGHRSVHEAARASDLVVALGYNSGGVVAALAGARTVFWDPARVTEGPMKDWFASTKWDNPKVMFTELEQLRQAVEQFFVSGGAQGSVGDLSTMLSHLDPFRDGQAARRIGMFVRWFLEACEQGLTREVALRAAVETYQQQWGSDKVWTNAL